MRKYILKRLIISIVTIWIIVTVSFFLLHSLPGDPFSNTRLLSDEAREQLMSYYGLDKPKWEQYITYIGNLLHGEFGYSIKYAGQSVGDIIKRTFPVSAQLGLWAFAISVPVGIFLGIVAAKRRGSALDYTLVAMAAVGVSLPAFVISTVLQYVFAIKLKWLPSGLWGTPAHMILPVLALALGSIANRVRNMRTLTLEIISEDYIKTAKAKGLSSFQISMRHMMRNAVIPMIPGFGMELATIILGSLVVEQIFAVPGMSAYLIDALNGLDYTMALGIIVFYGIIIVSANFIFDLIYALAEPRVSLVK